jgi:enoyl-CoA hydratase
MPEVEIHRDGAVATICIDRPHARNAISLATMEALEAVLDEVAAGDDAVVVLRGGGDRAFISGGDLRELAALRTLPEASAMATRMRRVLDRLASLPMPTIAALNGHALGGGGEVSVACDLRIAAADVRIAFNQALLAIMPAWGGVERLVELVGRSAALDLMLTGARISAEEAKGLGLVSRTLPRESFEEGVQEYAASIAALPRPVAAAIKATVTGIRPNTHREHEERSVRSFAELWVAEEHWAAAEALEAGRLAAKKATSPR